jgi:ATP-dependent Zn protease
LFSIDGHHGEEFMDETHTPINASYVFTLDEVKAAQATIISVQNIETEGNPSKIQTAIAVILIIGTLAFLFWKQGKISNLLDLAFYILPPVILLVTLWAILKYGRNKLLTRNFFQSPERDKTIEYEFSENAVFSKIEGIREDKLQWSSFIKVVQTAKGLLLYTQPQLAIWIPNHAFQSKEDEQAVAELAKRFVPKFFEAN